MFCVGFSPSLSRPRLCGADRSSRCWIRPHYQSWGLCAPVLTRQHVLHVPRDLLKVPCILSPVRKQALALEGQSRALFLIWRLQLKASSTYIEKFKMLSQVMVFEERFHFWRRLRRYCSGNGRMKEFCFFLGDVIKKEYCITGSYSIAQILQLECSYTKA